jgi:solute:Na+ symporter, SSS family
MLTIADYVVLAFYFVFMLGLGWVFKRFARNTSDYFRGGGEMLWWICGAGAFMVSFSAVSFTGMAGKAYADGPVVLVIFIGNAVGFFISYLWFAPLSRQTRAVTAMEVVRARFGRFSEQFFTWIQIPVGTFYAGLWLFGLAVFVSAGFGWSLEFTIIGTGVVVLIVALLGGNWSVTAGDFVQMLVLMPVTLVVAVLSLVKVGGPVEFVREVPPHFWNWGEKAGWGLIGLWVVMTLLQKFVSINSMQDCSRYLSVKDSGHARKAALLGTVLFVIGPVLWFIPPMAARIVYPTVADFPMKLEKPAEAAYFVMALATLPAGMMGLLLSGIFGATMSSMDGGLNKNAGFFVKNFWQPHVRPNASDGELMLVSKVSTVVLGVLIILAALVAANAKTLTIFEMMTYFGALVGVPTAVPLVLGLIFKSAPSWAGWTTVLVGIATSLLTNVFLSASDMTRYFGWEFNSREASDWVFISGTAMNLLVPSLWWAMACWIGYGKPGAVPEVTKLSEVTSLPEGQRIEALFTLMKKPVDFHAEEGNEGSDNRQAKVMGMLTLIYGAFVTALLALPNPWWGRLSFVFCGGLMLLIGWGLWRAGTKGSRTTRLRVLEVEGAAVKP